MPYKPPKPELPPVRIVREGGPDWHIPVIFGLSIAAYVSAIVWLIFL